jgi:hypothetical protein
MKKPINNYDDLTEAIDDWLNELSENYFSRDWLLKNVKKDSTAIRKQWSYLWESYRKNPETLPSIGDYSKNYK